MSVEEATLPEGVDPEDVEFDDSHPEVLAYDTSRTIEEYPGEQRKYPKPFDPRNGRWYDDKDPWPDIDSTSITVGHRVECAYSDCEGATTVEFVENIGSSCPECGEPKMGRGQFDSASQKQRAARQGVRNQLQELSDDFAIEMERLTDAGVGPTAAMDYLMCSVGDTSLSEWAEARDVKEESVKQNMKRVANALGETVRYKR